MQTKFEYINFVEQPTEGKTLAWSCRNNHYENKLGIIKWHGAWRQYCYFPTVQAVYSKGCLQDILTFIDTIKDIRKSDEK